MVVKDTMWNIIVCWVLTLPLCDLEQLIYLCLGFHFRERETILHRVVMRIKFVR